MSETTDGVSAELPNTQGPEVGDAIDAFLDKWEDSQNETSQSQETEGEAVEAVEEVSEQPDDALEDQEQIEESSEEDLDEEHTEQEETYEVAADDFVTEIKVGEEVHQVSVSDLKRLYGQEKALTQKSQQVANQRKSLDDEISKSTAAFQTLLTRAQEKFKPYSEIDMLVASQKMDVDEFAQLRKEAQDAYNDYQFLNQEAGKFMEQVSATRAQQVKAAAKESIELLQKEIPDWNEDLYNKIRDYAVTQGISKEQADALVDPAAIKLILKSMKYDQTKKVAVKKKVNTPTRVLKPGATPKVNPKKKIVDKQMEKFSKSGSLEDARDAFLARWQTD